MSGMKGRKNPNAGRKELPVDVEKVEHLASRGLTEQQIADVLGISWKTLHARKRKYEEFSDALKRGKSKGIATVANKLMEHALAGNITAQIFYLKTRDRDNWSEQQNHQVSGDIAINISPDEEEI